MRGVLITVEGVEGSGKTTQMRRLARWLTRQGYPVEQTREPDGTPLGIAVRRLFERRPQPLAEMFLFLAARHQHVAERLTPWLRRGRVVLCDRYTDATWAYQGGGHGVSGALIGALERHVHDDCRPDLTILFDVPPRVSRERLERAQSHGRSLDKFEREDASFTERVRAVYLERARAEPKRFRIVDSSRPQDSVRDELARLVADA